MPIRLLLPSRHHDDMPPQCHWLAQCHCHIITCLFDWNSSKLLKSKGAQALCYNISQWHTSTIYSYCITATSLTYLTQFFMKFHLKCTYCFVRMFSFFHPGCVIGVFALTCWSGSPVVCSISFLTLWLIPVSALGRWHFLEKKNSKKCFRLQPWSYGVRQRGKFGELPDPTHHRNTLTLITWQRNVLHLLF